MKKRTIVLLLLCCFFTIIVHAEKTELLYLSGAGSDDAIEWDFFCTGGRNSGKWGKIKVPSCWEMEGYGTFKYGHFSQETDESGLYKTKFKVPDGWKKKRIFIVFEGSMTDTEIKINGRLAGPPHQGAFYRFKREITSYVHVGKENLLEVKVDKTSSNKSVNEAERQCDFWVFGGIFRPVYLEAVPSDFIEYTAIDAKHQGELSVDVFFDKKLSGVNAEIEIKDVFGKSIGRLYSNSQKEKTGRISVTGKIDGVNPWSAEDPQLYIAEISLKRKGKILHTITDRIGFRTVEVKPHDGVYINGIKMRFKGVNRHSHYPTTGRTTSKSLSINDVKLMKEMNMNAVRMSHYPPDKHFLEVCDSLGLYVIDELCAWQYPPYDTEIGAILVEEMLKRDLNRPSIVFWANGNEGGFNFDLDPLFKQYDPQKRAVLHPWAFFDHINTVHYIKYNSGIGNMFHGRDIFMPTEILHGLYDGGHGAGLDDYWNLMLSHPLSAGMFLWDFADQAVVRSDKGNIYDTDKDHGADGILGPLRQKEGSFYTIKEIWSPIHLFPKYITPDWDGRIEVENRYSFTNSDACRYTYRFAKVVSLSDKKMQSIDGVIKAPTISPGNKGCLQLDLPIDWSAYDFLYITIKDKNEQELFTWSYEIGSPERVAERLLPKDNELSPVVKESSEYWNFQHPDIELQFDKQNGMLRSVCTKGKDIPLQNGPVLVTDQQLICDSVVCKTIDGIAQLTATYCMKGAKGIIYTFTWKLHSSGVLELVYNYKPQDMVRMAGITFDYPEREVCGAILLSKGPYRVYNNRMKGGLLSIWDKKYNNTVTGENWEYPEFKGYYSLFYGMKLNSSTPFEVYAGREDVFLHLFTPEKQKLYDPKRNYTLAEYPKGNISFMNAIPAVGTKFGSAENFGPQSQPHRVRGYGIENNVHGRLFFRF